MKVLLVLFFSFNAQADCVNEFKFGDRVEIIGDMGFEYIRKDFYKGQKGTVVARYTDDTYDVCINIPNTSTCKFAVFATSSLKRIKK